MVKKGIRLTKELLDAALAGGTILGGGGGGDAKKGRKFAEIAVDYDDLRLLPIEAVDEDAVLLTEKICKLRVFSDENGKMNRSVTDVGGGVLIVSNFTLYANTAGGNRPDFLEAAAPERANYLYRFFIEKMRGRVEQVGEGVFGADMTVRLTNDGPVTLILDSENLKKHKGSTKNA